MRRPTNPGRVLAALADGPGTCAELSVELGLRPDRCANELSRLVSCGRVVMSPEPVLLYGQAQATHIYLLPEHASRAEKTA